jgi:hypothetical protein
VTPDDVYREYYNSVHYVQSPIPMSRQAGRTTSNLVTLDVNEMRFTRIHDISELNGKYKTARKVGFGIGTRNPTFLNTDQQNKVKLCEVADKPLDFEIGIKRLTCGYVDISRKVDLVKDHRFKPSDTVRSPEVYDRDSVMQGFVQQSNKPKMPVVQFEKQSARLKHGSIYQNIPSQADNLVPKHLHKNSDYVSHADFLPNSMVRSPIYMAHS